MGLPKKKENPAPAPEAARDPSPQPEPLKRSPTAPPAPPRTPTESEEAPPRASLSVQDKAIVIGALIGLLAVIYFLFFHNSAGYHHGERQVGTLATEGMVRRRSSGALSWSNVEGRNPVYLRDIVFVPAGVKAVLTLNGKSIVIPPDTMIQLDESTIDDIEIMLTDGIGIPIMPPLHIKKFAQASDIASLELRWEELKERTKARLFTQLKLQPLLPLTSVPELSMEDIENYTLKILSPKENEKMDMKSGGWSKFSWTALPGKNIVYRVEISKTEDFAKILAQETKSLSVIIRLDAATHYFLRVSAVKKGRVIAKANSKFILIKGGKK